MSTLCADLDLFFDGELAGGGADAFREHLATCERCQSALRGRMQEAVVSGVAHERVEQPRETAVKPAHLEARRRGIVWPSDEDEGTA